MTQEKSKYEAIQVSAIYEDGLTQHNLHLTLVPSIYDGSYTVVMSIDGDSKNVIDPYTDVYKYHPTVIYPDASIQE